MNHQFDELTKSLAQSVTRRAALKKFSVGLAGIALACFGLANKAEANRCLRAGELCGNGLSGPSLPDNCLTNCCSHDANRVLRWGHYYWGCK